MATRAPERGRLERGQVARAEVLATDATGVLARTVAYPDPSYFAVGDSVFGFGETFLGLDKTGQSLDLWVSDAMAAPLFEPGGRTFPPGSGPTGGPGSRSVARGGCRPPSASAPCRCTCGKEW